MGLFGNDKIVHTNMHLRLGMEWRAMRNVYKNFLTEVQDSSIDAKLLTQIADKCDAIDREVNQGMQGFGKPKLNSENINGYMSEVIALDSQLEKHPPLAVRLKRLVGITVSIMSYNYEGIFEDARGNFADWYQGL